MNDIYRETEPAFEGVRVVEYAGTGSGVAAAYAGWQLAGMGARVMRLTAELDDEGKRATPVSLALDVLSDGKTGTPCPIDAAPFGALLESSDILLCDAPSELERLIGPVTSLNTVYPNLIIGIATTFGLDSPYQGYQGSALDAQALSATAWALGEPGRAPLSLPPGTAEHQSGAMLAAGCLLALRVRDEGKGGRVVDISLADVLASYVAGGCRYFVHHGLKWERSGRRASGSGGAYPFAILPCKDGMVCICGRTRDEWKRFVHAMGDPEWASEPRYQKLRAMGREYPDEVDALVMPWLAKHTMTELEGIALEHGLIVSPLRTFADVLETPHFKERGFLTESTAAGCSVKTPSLPFHVLETRSENTENIAPTLLKNSATLPTGDGTGTRPLSGDGTGTRPLSGLRVLDLGWVWSAPWVSTMLGELGAEVIKVEHANRPDNLRLAGRIVRDGEIVEGPSTEMSPMFHQVSHGKLGITLNTKDPEAVALLKRLAAISDVVIENMSPGSLERSGLGYEAFKAENPRIVMLAMSVAGQFGALTKMRAYAPTMSSFVGMESLIGYKNEDPIGALNLGLSDPSASVHALVPLLAALRQARATGEGCYIDFSQIEALLSTLRPYFLDMQVQGRQPRPLGNGHPKIAPHGIYPAIGEDKWLTLTVADDAQWRSLSGVAKDQTWATDKRYETTSGRLDHADALDAAISSWSASQDRDELVANLRVAGVASSPVLSVEELWHEPHFTARGMKQSVDIPIYGQEDLFKAPWRFSDFAPEITRCGPTTGEHNGLVFGELLGLSGGEIAELEERGVIA
jgi:crotonobetainyl-CoA:carnitine CoA-transferase CaiB-like acyl-CoA transferase